MAANDEDKRKYLEFVQNVITRMASNTFVIKGWAITAIGALYAYWIANQDHRLLLLILIITIFFWAHDAYYLHLERGFRNLYDKVRENNSQENMDFKMTPIFTETTLQTAFRYILVFSYGIITVATLALIFFTVK